MNPHYMQQQRPMMQTQQKKQPLFANPINLRGPKKKTTRKSSLTLEQQMNSNNFTLGTFI